MSTSLKGRINQILEPESGTSKAGKAWRKQSFVIDTGAQFNPLVCFSLFGDDKISLLNNINPGQEVEVAFNVSSREFNGKWYHNIDAWKIDALGGNASGDTPPPPSEEPISLNTADLSATDEDDDLPF